MTDEASTYAALDQRVAALTEELAETRRLAEAAVIAAADALTLCTELLHWTHENLQPAHGGAASPIEIAGRLDAAFDALRVRIEGSGHGS